MFSSLRTLVLAFAVASVATAGATPSDVRLSTDFGGLAGSANATASSFGTVTAMLPMLGSSTATLEGPVVDSALGTITISGFANAFANVGNQGAAIDVDFSIFAECDFDYLFTAAVEQGDTSSVPSSYGISVGGSSATVFLPLPGTSPISLSGTLASGTSQNFGFLSLLSDFGGDGFDIDFHYELVLTAQDPSDCDCFANPDPNTVPEPASLFVWSLLGGIGCIWAQRRRNS